MSIIKNENEGRDVSVSNNRLVGLEPTTTSSPSAISTSKPTEGWRITEHDDGTKSGEVRTSLFGLLYSSSHDVGMVPLLVAVLVATVGSKHPWMGSFSGENTWAVMYLSVLMLVLNGALRRRLSNLYSSDETEEALRATTAKLSSTIKRISSKQCWESLQGNFSHKSQDDDHVSALSANEPFVPIDVVSELLLSDITRVFQYAMCNTSEQHAEESPLLKQVLKAVDAAVSISRGLHAVESSKSALSHDDMDALKFCAAVRIFAEWRMVRQVPDGYKGYSVGMNLGRRDVVQNLAKIENAVHAWIEHKKAMSSSNFVTSPTLRELLQHEIDTKVHRSLPRLKDKTAAMGLLWVVRQLQYQTCVYANLIRVPDLHSTTSEAVEAAYKEVYSKYHGWAVQKIFNYSFQKAPPAKEIYKFMNPPLLKQVIDNAQEEVLAQEKEVVDAKVLRERETFSCTSCSATDDDSFQFDSDDSDVSADEDGDWDFVPNVMETSFLSEMSFSSDDDSFIDRERCEKNPFENFGKHIAQEWEKFGKHVAGGWDEFLSSISNAFDGNSRQKVKQPQHQAKDFFEERPEKKSIDCGELRPRSILEDQEAYISRKMTTDAHRHIMVHLEEVTQPMMQDLASLIEGLGMNDPSKV